jgi:glutamyl-tRNA reductase
MSHRLVNKILHQPTLRLKSEAAQGNAAAYSATVRHLFGLDEPQNGVVSSNPTPKRKNLQGL